VHGFANARAAIFARGIEDMARLARARGGRIDTVAGLAGAGDLYVTCLGGRNGTFGRLLGLGQTPQQAQETIGSTVEGIANTHAALAVAARFGIDLPTARAVDSVLSQRVTPQAAVTELMHSPATTDLRPGASVLAGAPGRPVS
jgi:glycerol-3-phosphate dehydrogenase (NAD(P)+)